MGTKSRLLRMRAGQALMELAVGLFALALLVSALCGFTIYIAKSLRAQNALRGSGSGSKSASDRVEVGDFAAQHVFGSRVLRIHEKVVMPQTVIAK